MTSHEQQENLRHFFTKDDNTDEKILISKLEIAFAHESEQKIVNNLEKPDTYFQDYFVCSTKIDTPCEVISHIFLGSGNYAENKLWLTDNKISYIINIGQPQTSLISLLDDYLKIDLSDEETSNIKQFFEQTNEFIQKAISKDKNILIHCRAGLSRSPTIVCAYLMKYHKLNLMDAMIKISDKRGICPNRGFWHQLEEYEQELKNLNKIKNEILVEAPRLTDNKKECSS